MASSERTRVAIESAPLQREVTCIRSLAWRVDFGASVPLDALIEELRSRGLSVAPAIKGLRRMVTPEGHEVVFVERSGRVQIRVHYTVLEEERRFTAERLYVVLMAAWLASGELSDR